MKVWALILAAVEQQGVCAMVSVAATEGSAPRDAGARIIVTRDGFHGTIGGGTLEWHAIAAAQSMLSRGSATKITSHALGPELGQCCGGRVQLATEIFDRSSLAMLRDIAAREARGRFTVRGRLAALDFSETFGASNRHVYLFGAGHVGRALVLALAPLPVDVRWIDSRPNAFPRVAPGNVTLVAAENPVAELAEAAGGSLVYVMTHSHALDLAVVDAALRNSSVSHVGLIGSATKRARFEKRLRTACVEPARVDGLICPIGIAGIASKEPAMIAAAAAAQILILDEQLRATETTADGATLQTAIAGGMK